MRQQGADAMKSRVAAMKSDQKVAMKSRQADNEEQALLVIEGRNDARPSEWTLATGY